MTSPIPTPSTETHKPRMQKMRFLYPLAAVCIATVMLTPSTTDAQPSKASGDRARLIELALQDVEPAMRPMARTMIEEQFSKFSDAQIAMMLAQQAANAAKPKPAPAKAELPPREITAEDRTFMKAQYEPLMRKHHAAQVEFDNLVNTKIAAYCPASGVYARFGSGWRYEVGHFMMDSALGANNVDTRVTIAGEAYMPKDGRYTFDFSKVRTTFDKGAVEAAIKSACGKVHATGKAFLAKVDPMIAKQDWDGAFKAEGSANYALEPIRAELQAAYDKLGPGDIGVFQLAMMNGKRIN